MTSATDLSALEAKLGYRFVERDLLLRALTHVTATTNSSSRGESYQRLEFLGDRVLGLAVAEMLYEAFPGADEGELSRRLADLVRAEACAEVAMDMDLGPWIRMGEGEAQSGGRRKKAILADACEAVVGAIFLDGGFTSAKALVERYWHARMMAPRRPLRDAKTALQEWAQGRGLPAPVYRETARSGPDHNPLFTVAVSVEGLPEGMGAGRSKRIAEQVAAQAVLMREGVWTEDAND